jgi:hypothetical protein
MEFYSGATGLPGRFSEGFLLRRLHREMKRRRAYEKPSERRAREKAESIRRHRKMLRKRHEREGY